MIKKILIVLGILIVLLIIFRIGADLWGRSKLKAYDLIWRQAITAMRQRNAAHKVPVLNGQPIDENAAPLYKNLMAVVEKDDVVAIRAAAKIQVGTPLPPEAVKLLDERRPVIAQLREALHRTHCDWNFKYEDGFYMELPNFLPAQTILARLLILEGHKHAYAGDLSAAADRYLETVKFGNDIASGPMITVMIGSVIAGDALDSLMQIVVLGGSKPLLLAELERDLAQLESSLPSFVDAIRIERTIIGTFKGLIEHKSYFDIIKDLDPNSDSASYRIYSLVLPIFIPSRAILADAVTDLEPLYEEAERGAALADRTEQERIFTTIKDRAGASWNPIVNSSWSMGVFNQRYGLKTARVKAKYRLIQTAIAIERQRSKDGRYPQDQTLINLPIDPLASPAKLNYQAASDGRGYKIWSVGENGKDDGGTSGNEGADDIVLERK